MTTQAEYLSQVTDAISRALHFSGAELKADTYLIKDLNAESIDFLDISYEIEQATGRRLNFRDLLQTLRDKHGPAHADFRISDIAQFLFETESAPESAATK